MAHHLLDVLAQGPWVPLKRRNHALELFVRDGNTRLPIQNFFELLFIVGITQISQFEVFGLDVGLASQILLKQRFSLNNK